LQTGGSAFGEISTRSNPCSSAIFTASLVEYTPISTFSPTNRTLGAVILEFILCLSS